ncbi:MAG: acyl-CoA synthetase FdrA [Clostridiaceae bacterium]|nr:acyl-CoA synthetase FdrA [Clostridiaceae bacterium]
MELKYKVKKNTYYDSVTLMLITKEIKKMDGVEEVLIGMGTDLNKELVRNLSLITEEIEAAGPNDFFVTLLGDESVDIDNIVVEIDKLLNQKKKASGGDYMPPTLESALNNQPDSNIAVISVAGNYAADEVRKALDNDLHVMLFSDNVTMEDERELKELAKEKGLLMMGPDCGTAIINNVPLAFANVIKKGNIGVVGASGTGTQEVTVLVDKLGEGVSQVIGTGGRDLKEEIGGIMMLQGIEALKNDPETKVIVLISKPPAEEVAEKVLKATQNCGKPVVVDFIGGDRELIEKYGAYACSTLEDTAQKAVALLRGEEAKEFEGFTLSDEEINALVEKEVSKFHPTQKYLRGLYTGGTLADEAMKLLSKDIGDIYSNIPLTPEYKLQNINKSTENTCIDLGDDDFTAGKPHPMIDPSTRVDRLVKEMEDEEVAVVLMDFVLGYGAHEDPVGEMLEAIKDAKVSRESKGQYLSVIASVCGTENDPQNLAESQKRLEEAGVIVMPSNAQAVRLVGMVLKKNQLALEV